MSFDTSVCLNAVVVGDDGSKDAAHAVRWSGADAQRRGAPLVVLRAWSLTTAPRPKDISAGYVPSEDEFADAVRAELTADLHATLGDLPGVEVLATPVHGSAKQALVDASQVAAVVVVAARGGGFARLLGSTSEHVVKHGQGPIVVIPAGALATLT